MFHQSAGSATINCDNWFSRQPTVRWSIETVGPCIHIILLDYCNSLLYGIADGLLQKLQSVQTQPHVWSPGRDGKTTSHRCYASCTSCPSDSTSSLLSGLQLTAWPSINWLAKSGILIQLLSSRLWIASICGFKNLCRSTNAKPLWDRSFYVSDSQQWNTTNGTSSSMFGARWLSG